MVKRYRVSNGLLIIRTAEQHDAFNLKNLHVVMAEDFDNVAAVLLKVQTDMLRDDFDSENDRCEYVLAYVREALRSCGCIRGSDNG